MRSVMVVDDDRTSSSWPIVLEGGAIVDRSPSGAERCGRSRRSTDLICWTYMPAWMDGRFSPAQGGRWTSAIPVALFSIKSQVRDRVQGLQARQAQAARSLSVSRRQSASEVDGGPRIAWLPVLHGLESPGPGQSSVHAERLGLARARPAALHPIADLALDRREGDRNGAGPLVHLEQRRTCHLMPGMLMSSRIVGSNARDRPQRLGAGRRGDQR